MSKIRFRQKQLLLSASIGGRSFYLFVLSLAILLLTIFKEDMLSEHFRLSNNFKMHRRS